MAGIREVDAIVHVIRCFEDDDIIHVDDSVDPAHGVETINLELTLSGTEVLDRWLDKTRKMFRADKKYQMERGFFECVRAELDTGHTARSVKCTEEEAELLTTVSLLANKLAIYTASTSDTDFKGGAENNPYFAVIKKLAR